MVDLTRTLFTTKMCSQEMLTSSEGQCENSQEMDKGVCSVTPTKRKLLEGKNVKSLIATFEVLPGKSPDSAIGQSESPAKKRKLR